MCQYITVLSQDLAGHTVAQCEHGTIHFFWVRVNILLTPDEFLSLLSFLPNWEAPQAELMSQGFYLARRPDGLFQFWCKYAGLVLTEAELFAMRDLLWLAAQQLNLVVSTPARKAPSFTEEYHVLAAVPERVGLRN